jgi:uncharacterized protein (TIGR02145 family)
MNYSMASNLKVVHSVRQFLSYMVKISNNIERMNMLSRVTAVFIIILFAGLVNIIADDSSIKVYVYDDHTNNPIESAFVSLLKDGVVIDSTYTSINGSAELNLTVTSVGMTEVLPSSISLSNNYPNPFDDKTNVELNVPGAQTITASIYNILGQRVASERIYVSGGEYTLTLSMSHLPMGIYFLRLGGRESQAVKLTKMGNNVHYTGPLFSVSTSRLHGNSGIGKIADIEFTLTAEKEHYEGFETSLNGTENGEIEIPLSSIDILPANDDATLKDLTVDGQTVSEFDPEELKYNVELPFGTPKAPDVDATTNNPDASVRITKTASLPGIAVVEVTAVDGTTQLIYEINFTVESNETVTDIDGNVYPIVQIGDQWWMTENIKVTHYRNGDPIENLVDEYWRLTDGEWHKNHKTKNGQLYTNYWFYSTEGAFTAVPWIIFDGGSLGNMENVIDAYGLRYNFYAVDDPRGLCPEGWHIPSDEEWKQLEMNMGLTRESADEVGFRGEHENIAGKLRSTRSYGISRGEAYGTRGDNIIYAESAEESSKFIGGSIIWIGHGLPNRGSYTAQETHTVVSVNGSAITISGQLGTNYGIVRSDEETAFISEIVDDPHPRIGGPMIPMNRDATNESGLNILPMPGWMQNRRLPDDLGGTKYFDEMIMAYHSRAWGGYWTSTTNNLGHTFRDVGPSSLPSSEFQSQSFPAAWYRLFYPERRGVLRNSYLKNTAFSVRCIMD